MSVDVSTRTESIPVPPIPDFRTAHGPVTTRLLRRTLLSLSAVWAVALLGVALDISPRWTAFCLGLLLPGAGQLATGHLLWGAVAVLGMLGALFVWWLCGNVLLLPLAWLAPAALAARFVDGPIGTGPEVATAAGLALVVAWSLAHPRWRHRRQRVRGAAYNERLRVAAPTLRRHAPAATATEATAEDLKTLRYLMDLALQPEDSWEGFFFVKPEQFREGAVRYQLNFVSYATAMYQYTRTPAFSGYAAEAQRNMIAKMTHKSVWSYWALENLWGNLRWDPDPIVKDNVMYSGYLGLMLGLYETTTGDRRYHRPGSLELRWSDRKTFRYDYGSICDALVDNFGGAPSGQFPCEPNWIYPMCNTFGVNSLLAYDRLTGSDHASAVVERVRASYENGDYCEPDGRLTAARSGYFGFRHPMVGNMGDAITTYLLNPILPDIARRTWWLVEHHHLGSEVGVVEPKHRMWNRIDPGNYGVGTDRFTRAALAANAREYGDDASADALVASMADRVVEAGGARRYRGLSVWGNLYLALTQFGREDAFRGLVHDGYPEHWRTGPRLAEVAYPDVLVAYAVTDGTGLDLVLVPGDGPVRTTITFDRLVAGQTYAVSGACADLVTADEHGHGLVEIDLLDRTSVTLTPHAVAG